MHKLSVFMRVTVNLVLTDNVGPRYLEYDEKCENFLKKLIKLLLHIKSLITSRYNQCLKKEIILITMHNNWALGRKAKL